jgi:hypothetical protein
MLDPAALVGNQLERLATYQVHPLIGNAGIEQAACGPAATGSASASI